MVPPASSVSGTLDADIITRLSWANMVEQKQREACMQMNAASKNGGASMTRKLVLSFCSLALMASAGYAKPKAASASDAGQPKMSGAKESSSSGWSDKWPDGTSTGAEVTSSGDNAFTVTGNSAKQSYGGVHKKVSVDLDKTPTLTIDIPSVSGFWYLIAKSPKIKQGYVKIQPDTDTTGKQTFDIKALTGLSGKQEFELEVGVSSGKADPNKGKSVTFKNLTFAAAGAAGQTASIPGAVRVSPWKDKWPDGTPSGATVKEGENGGFTITGNSKKASFGNAYRVVTVNLDKTPTLNINAVSGTGSWYIEASGGNIKEPVKVQPDTDMTGAQTYDLKGALGLTGEQSFELHVGVTSGNETPNAGKEVTFNGLAFTAPAATQGSNATSSAPAAQQDAQLANWSER
jgi:hypothetical protein